MIAGAVEDNVRAIRNQPPGKLHRTRPFPWPTAIALGAVALAMAATLAVLRLPDPVFEAAPARSPGAPPTAAVERLGADRDGPALIPAPPVRVPGGVFPLAVRRVALDPGHGGQDLGTRNPTGLSESRLTLEIARRVAKKLRAAGIEPILTRDGDDRVVLDDRARIANEADADLFVSIHVNWFEDGRVNRGIETFYLGPSDDPAVTRLASLENRDSGYSLSDVRRLLDSIYADLRQQQSRALATEVQRRLLRSVREVAPEVRDRGVKSAPFLVLVTTEMPAILAEVACLSNAEEARLLASPEYRERIASALFDGIAAYSRSIARTEAAGEGEREVR